MSTSNEREEQIITSQDVGELNMNNGQPGNNQLSTNVERPSYLTPADLEGYNQIDLAKRQSPNRLKIIQGQSSEELKEKFAEGDIIITPDLVKIGDKNTAFSFVPTNYFTMFMAINPYALKATLPTVRDRTSDPKSDLAKKAKAFKVEICPESPPGKQEMIKYHVSDNFMILLQPDERSPYKDVIAKYLDTPLHMYSTRGEIRYFQILVNLIQGRWNRDKIPMFALRFRCHSGTHEYGANKWKGFDFLNDTVPMVQTREEFDKFQQVHVGLKELIEQNLLDLDYSDLDSESAANDPANDKKFG